MPSKLPVLLQNDISITLKALFCRSNSRKRVLIAAKLILGHSAVAHPADPGTQEVFQMIRNIPNKENRVIGVITKCDRKQEGADNWVNYLQ